jgi:PAS domain S-box-containing protein
MSDRQLDGSALLTAIIESSDDAIMTTDLDGTVTFWNPGAERLYGYSASEIVGQSTRILIAGDRYGNATRVRERLAAGQPVQPYDSVSVRKDGTLINVSISVFPLRASDQTVVGIAAIARDISERKRSESERRQAERRIRRILEAMSDTFAAFDRNWRITHVNQRYVELSGLPREALIGRVVWDVFPDASQMRLHEAAHRAVREHRPVTVEDYFAPLDRWIQTRLYPMPDGLATFGTDITERKRSAERAAFLAEAGAVVAASLDHQAMLKAMATLAVPAVADFCAVDIVSEDRLDRLAVAHVDPGKIELARLLRERYDDADSPYSAATVIRSGKAAWVRRVTDETIADAAHGDAERIALIKALNLRSYIVVPISGHGRTFGALTLATAQSGRVYTEDDVQLAGDVASRMAIAMENARAYHEARVANRLKDEFLATLSHELRTPLNAILGYSRLVQSGVLTRDKQTRAFTTIERNAHALTQIVEDVLDVSRIISGKIRLHIQPIDLSQVVRNAVDTVFPAAEAKQIRLRTELDPRTAAVPGDSDRLQQVVWNLVSNAVKFTPPHGLVRVHLERVNSHVEITVTDTGIGIDPAFLPHMFERFRQADSGTTREHGGIGLGLAIVRHLVELHGGTVEAESAGRGHGATFRVRLPLIVTYPEEGRERRTHPNRNAETATVAVPDLRGVEVLAVDDDADARMLVRESLESVGASVTTVDSVGSAFDVLRTRRPDVLLADIGLPDVDGFALIRGLRESSDPAVRDIPAAAVTAYARSEDRLKSLQSGFQMHLSKPIDPRELMLAVATLTKRNARHEVGDD